MTIAQTQIDNLAEQILHHAWANVPQGWYAAREEYIPQSLPNMIASWGDGSIAYPVSAAYCNRTIYTNCPDGGPCINMAFRAWHDSLHIRRKRTTDTKDEIKLGCLHTVTILGEHERAIILADTVGQTLHYERFNAFPEDQANFVNWCLSYICAVPRSQVQTLAIAVWRGALSTDLNQPF